MSSAAIQVFDSSGSLTFNSSSVSGGVVAGVYHYAAGAGADTLTFPAFAGWTPFLVFIYSSTPTHNVTVDTSLGYPRVTVGASGPDRYFAVMMK